MRQKWLICRPEVPSLPSLTGLCSDTGHGVLPMDFSPLHIPNGIPHSPIPRGPPTLPLEWALNAINPTAHTRNPEVTVILDWASPAPLAPHSASITKAWPFLLLYFHVLFSPTAISFSHYLSPG